MGLLADRKVINRLMTENYKDFETVTNVIVRISSMRRSYMIQYKCKNGKNRNVVITDAVYQKFNNEIDKK